MAVSLSAHQEDVDAAVEGESSISFSALLNALDGTVGPIVALSLLVNDC